jgi:hypothetical protein
MKQKENRNELPKNLSPWTLENNLSHNFSCTFDLPQNNEFIMNK